MNTPNKNYPELGQPSTPQKEPKNVLEAMDSNTRLDNWYNTVSGFGSAAKSKMANISYSAYEVIGREQAEELYRGDWAARKSVDAPIFDMFREGIDWMEEEGQESTIEAIDEEFKIHKIWRYVLSAEVEAWKQGGALAVFSFDDPFDDEEELNPNLVKGIKRIDIIPGGRNGLAQEIEWDIDYDSPTRGDATHYLVTFNYRNQAFTKRIHASRVVRFDSPFSTSQLQRMRNAGWNDSRFQSIYDSLRSMGVAVQSGEETLENFTFMVLKSSGLADAMKKGTNAILNRILSLVNKITSGRVAMIGQDETLEKIGTPLTGFHELATQHTKYFTAATWIPHSRFFNGESGALGGDTMDGELKNYYDWIAYLREFQIRPAIERVLEFLSYYMGFETKDVNFDFPPLNQLTALQQATLYYNMAQGDSIYIDKQVVTPEEVAVSRFGGKEFDHTSMHVDFNDPSREEDMLGAEQAEQMINGKDEQNPMDGENNGDDSMEDEE